MGFRVRSLIGLGGLGRAAVRAEYFRAGALNRRIFRDCGACSKKENQMEHEMESRVIEAYIGAFPTLGVPLRWAPIIRIL